MSNDADARLAFKPLVSLATRDRGHKYSDKQKRAAAYPLIPGPKSNGAPAKPGVYFIWEGDEIIYIGQSINLFQRLWNHNHKGLNRRYSWIHFSENELVYAESFYIGICRPKLNARTPS
jgi:hypothetical protein